ncbi:MAG: 4Fe-4S dicluster domain-containing protein, partial [Bacteroidales bacterium]
MGNLFELIQKDVRFEESLKACMNCGVCTAICAAAEFYQYDPRQICDIVQSRDEEALEALLRSDTIWYCGQCMSCKPRCPRGNIPGLLISILRQISQELGYFTQSEKGRQQFAVEQVVGKSIVTTGYCVHPDIVQPDLHPEQGPIWRWYIENYDRIRDSIADVFDEFHDFNQRVYQSGGFHLEHPANQ